MKQIAYINLEERQDRRAQLEQEMKTFGLEKDQIQRFPAIKTQPGYIGCSKSHAGVIQHFLDQDDETSPFVAVFEDDFTWTMSRAAVEKRLEEFMSTTKDWDVLILAAPNYGLHVENTEMAGIKRCKCAQTTTAYLVNRQYAPKLIEVFEESARRLEAGGDYGTWAADQAWKKLQAKDNWFIAQPGFGKQRASYSDIEKRNVEYHGFI